MQEDFFDKNIANKTNVNGYYIVKPNDFVYNPRISTNAPVGPIKQNETGLVGIVSPLYSIFRISHNINSKFIKYFFSSDKWYKYIKGVANYGARHDRINITQKDLYNMPITLPSKLEQKKISEFLDLIDKKRILLKNKYQKHLDFKKYLMQQIFTQKLRFDFNEKWKVYKLKDLLGVKSSNISINKVDNNTGDYPLYGTGGYLQNIDFYEMEDEYISITKDGSVGKIDYHEGKSSIINTSQYLIPNKKFNIRFLYYQLQTLNFEKYIVGSSIPHIYFKDYGNEKVKIPNLLEQEIIAKLFIVIDKKLYMLDKSISLMYRFKKGLLQQMFI